jgi:hypothetical protein
LLARRISQVCWQIVPESNGTWEKQAARIVTGLASYASLLSIYKETGWEKLSVRREKRKLSLFYDIVSGQSPDYLQDLLPITVGLTNNYNFKLHLNRSHLRLLHF